MDRSDELCRSQPVRHLLELGQLDYADLPLAGLDEAALAGDMAARDERDSSREADPLQQVAGALRVDTTGLGVQEVVERLLETITQGR